MSSEKLIPTLKNSMGTSYGCSALGDRLGEQALLMIS